MTALGEAVRAGDTEAVRTLLEGGADPNAPDGDGLPPLCAAVAAFAHEAADVLVEAGADPDRVLPDGTTPLLRAVEGGSPAVVSALLWSRDLPEPGERLPEAERARLLDAARRWCVPLRGAESPTHPSPVPRGFAPDPPPPQAPAGLDLVTAGTDGAARLDSAGVGLHVHAGGWAYPASPAFEARGPGRSPGERAKGG
ncbi:ankyrin repeat domain-containing protein [Streptomyces sp. NBC_00193]|uniref:ankyrin repeat domain-containing protein n=1 Tax=Streptomyces sp. NBC_00193 TaxID=2975675 RepID=UPI002255ED2C|nr:ankyrin repeat domain-containing protein [Streptomyces sp. NBC_00193]MCX5296706.1 ankyrin repeat domain-containing protein [Streptomyces sp. NBC_00193]